MGSSRPWANVAIISTNNGSATLLLAAATARQSLLISNEDAANAVRIRFDGSDATSDTGILLLAGRAIYFAPGDAPLGKVSAYATAVVAISVAYTR